MKNNKRRIDNKKCIFFWLGKMKKWNVMPNETLCVKNKIINNNKIP